jgi:hypothetical protein
VQKSKFKILVLAILISSVSTIDGYEFLHNHDSGTDNHCISCLLSSSLIAVNPDVIAIEGLKVHPDFTINLQLNSIQPEYFLSSVSDRAPPIS